MADFNGNGSDETWNLTTADVNNVANNRGDGGGGNDTLRINLADGFFDPGMEFSVGDDVGGFGAGTARYVLSSGEIIWFKNFERFDLTGGNGVNVLVGGAGNDILRGGTFENMFNAGTGVDQLIGTKFSTDIVIADRSAATVDIVLSLAATRDADVITADGTLWRGIDVVQLKTGSGNDFIDISNVSFSQFSDVQPGFLFSGAGNDTFSIDETTSANTHFDGGGDVDTLVIDFSQLNAGLTSGTGNDNGTDGFGAGTSRFVITSIFGGASSFWFRNVERFEITAGGDPSRVNNFSGGALNDILHGADFANDIIDGGAGDDLITGGQRDDTITGGAGADSLDGGDQTDTLSYSASPGQVVIDLAANTAAGGDAQGDIIANFENAVGSAFADILLGTDAANTLDGGAEGDFLLGRGGNDVLNGGDGDDALHGEAGNDDLRGNNGADVLVGLDGNDTLNGAAGDDTLIAGDGADQLFGGAGIDQMFGYGDDDTLDGGTEGDFLSGGDGNDTLNGGDGDDAIHGEGGNDTGFGGLGNDVLVGYDGNDTLNGGDGNDTIIGGLGDDVLNGDDGNDQMYAYEGVDTVNGGLGDDFLAGGIANDTLHGDDGGDVLDGQEDNDQLFGDDGGDNLNGNLGNDTLFGGAGNDGLLGLDGDDVLDGGTGNDFLIGDTADGSGTRGNDTFVFHDGTGNDNVADLQAGVGVGDVIDVRDFHFADFNAVLAAATDLPNGTYIQLDADDAIFLEHVAKSALAADDFLLI